MIYPLHTWVVTFEPTHSYLGTNCLPYQCQLYAATSLKILSFMTSLTTYFIAVLQIYQIGVHVHHEAPVFW